VEVTVPPDDDERFSVWISATKTSPTAGVKEEVVSAVVLDAVLLT
jgi:hypothetical protein